MELGGLARARRGDGGQLDLAFYRPEERQQLAAPTAHHQWWRLWLGSSQASACLGAVVRAGWGHGEGRHGVVLGDCVWQAAAVCQGRQCCVEVVTR